ncbi:4,5-dioxygenase [Vibrio sp. CAIM 722]|uniref:4,5-dioxygenase n=1 Tax=Vibrio eleionomae TaxID=2653505 RepID=A0A7X4LLW7_9VIBR|nr:DOPA 4,5-dioxygenase family protein [Vibrio eleionomae]MZI94309.1 4,5-dioxygenase [Vibrio eleionomae]
MPTFPANNYAHYHAHIYFDANTLAQATELCTSAGKEFDIKVGRVHQKKVGPHPHWSCQLAFNHPIYNTIMPWLESKRDGLTVLVHGVTDNELKDHTEHLFWLGESKVLDLSVFTK